ncbi:hypothetical protein SAMN05660690_2354 [Geodermatophilus telluris]|uniref:Uncharacterized protein n=1 Tax=Geodermatophilus telluris TaxID=1190417 RepID=A0A1G6P357_9ACTN|nr:hypothetical protein [Geodermatophilus telluris]SDC73857.1 hypothetical protein SAMN05660690_2354 [Geodermatophilus telluris]
MSARSAGPYLDRFLAAAEEVARSRPGVDPEAAREVFREVAQLLHDGLVLDDLDGHDTRVAVEGLCADLVAEDPGTALRARARAAVADPGDLHDPRGVSAAYLTAAAVLQL